jgi:hypothetical protein
MISSAENCEFKNNFSNLTPVYLNSSLILEGGVVHLHLHLHRSIESMEQQNKIVKQKCICPKRIENCLII